MTDDSTGLDRWGVADITTRSWATADLDDDTATIRQGGTRDLWYEVITIYER